MQTEWKYTKFSYQLIDVQIVENDGGNGNDDDDDDDEQENQI